MRDQQHWSRNVTSLQYFCLRLILLRLGAMFLGVLVCSREQCCGSKERVQRRNNSCTGEASSPSTAVLRAANKAS